MGNTNKVERGAPITKMTCVALSIANLLAMPTSASAADITVANGGCTIVDAVRAANTNMPAGDCVEGDPDATATDVIILPTNSTQSITSAYAGGDNALPVITSDITIQGNGSTLRRDSGNPFRLIEVSGGGGGNHLTINDLTIENGNHPSGGGIFAQLDSVSLINSTVSGNSATIGNGGGILAQSSSVSLINSTVSGNSASSFYGGGIYATSSSVSLSNSTVSGNSASNGGGGISATSNSSVSLSNSTVSGNSATIGSGGGILAQSSSVSLINSTVSGNSASSFYGGGIHATSSSISLSNSTVSGNSAYSGGGINARSNSSVSLINSTVSGNSASSGGGGIRAGSSTVNLSNSIVANSSNNDDLFDNGSLTLTSDSASIIEEASFSGSRTSDPGLLPLADNGGPTQTHALSYGSIALDTGDITTCSERDQRGRLRGTPCNVGSFEVGTGDIMVGVAGCTLVDAVRSANTNTAIGGCEPGEPDSLATDMIVLPNNSTQSITNAYAGGDNALPVIASNITIQGNGSTMRRDSVDQFRLIRADGPYNLTINDLTIENGYIPGLSGGGIFVSGAAELSLNGSTVSGNFASYCGGGIDALSGSSISLNNSTVSGNSASFGGGLSAFDSSSISLINSTVSGNFGAYGGGINISDNSSASLTNGTVSGNSASDGGGIYAYSSSVSLTNSIIANSSNSDDVYLTNAASLSSDTASIIEEASFSDSRTGDPGLLPLANNGGLTKTHALKANSIARDTGILGTCTSDDQRGQIRDDGDSQCDVGALEYNRSDRGSDDTSFFVIPLGNGKVAVIPL